jgi:hypothetical protein
MLLALIVGCGEAEKEAKFFKASEIYADLTRCIGMDVPVKISAFSSSQIKSDDDRVVVEAVFDKSNNNYTAQWIYSKELGLSEFVYIGKSGESESILRGNNFGFLCGNFDLTKNLKLSDNKRNNKKYGFNLAGFGGTTEAKARTIELSKEINALNIENSRPVKMLDNGFSVITENVYDEYYENFMKIYPETLEKEFRTKGMNLDVAQVIILKPYIKK